MNSLHTALLAWATQHGVSLERVYIEPKGYDGAQLSLRFYHHGQTLENFRALARAVEKFQHAEPQRPVLHALVHFGEFTWEVSYYGLIEYQEVRQEPQVMAFFDGSVLPADEVPQ